MQYDNRTQFCTFQQDDLVLIRDFNKRSNSKWLPGTITKPSGVQSYKIRLADGKVVRRHADHISSRHTNCISMPSDELDDIPIPTTKVNDSATSPLHRSERNR